MSFFNIKLAQVVCFFLEVMAWMMMAWQHKEPGHQQLWYRNNFSMNNLISYPQNRTNILCVILSNNAPYKLHLRPDLNTLQWLHNERDGVSNHHPHNYLINRLFRRRLKNTSKLRVTDFCAGNSSVTGEFPAQRASSAEYGSIWWRHRERFGSI